MYLKQYHKYLTRMAKIMWQYNKRIGDKYKYQLIRFPIGNPQGWLQVSVFHLKNKKK